MLAKLTALLLLSGVGLAGCTPVIDRARVEAQIKGELEQQGAITLKSVSCPQRVAIAPGSTFTCTGELDPQGIFPILVTQSDAQGNVKWQVPNSKGLLNLKDLETAFQQAIATETGAQPQIDCGGRYRINKPGDSFDCRITNPSLLKKGQTQITLLNVRVTLDAQGNVSWQQVRRQQVIASAATQRGAIANPVKAGAANPGNASPNASPPTAPASTQPVAAPPAGKTAEDFLNKPGAMDGF
jgi:hypothetical protein